MKKIRHVFCDLDGTLYGKDLTISNKVAQAVNGLQRIGFSICTARGVDEAFELTTKLNLRSPQIVENGATIVNPDKSIIQRHFLAERTVLKLVQCLSVYPIWKKVCINGALLDFEYSGDMQNVTKIALQDITEAMWDDINKKLLKYPDIYYSISKAAHKPGYLSLDISSLRSTKQEAVHKVMQMLKLNIDEVMGIGDSYNDFPLLMACGTKVAMGNAVDKLKEIADIIAPNVSDDGVADVLSRVNFRFNELN